MTTPLLALSFLQPWLWAILGRHKGVTAGGAFYAVENRTWRPSAGMVGATIALHASAGWDREGADFVDDQLELAGVPAAVPPKAWCVRGAIVGTARIAGAVHLRRPFVGPAVLDERFRIDEQLVAPLLASPWAFGPWAWALADVRPLLDPIPCKGALGFWPVPAHLAALVREREAA
jgi:hypothetical protein